MNPAEPANESPWPRLNQEHLMLTATIGLSDSRFSLACSD